MTLPESNVTLPGEPQGLGVEVINGTVLLSWNPPSVLPSATEFEIFSAASSLTPVESKSLVWRGTATMKTLVLSTNSTVYYQVRAIRVGTNTPSGFTPNTYGLPVVPAIPPPSPTASWTAYLTPTFVRTAGRTATLVTGFVSVTVVGSCTPVFSWSLVSSSAVTAGVGSAPSTQFTATGMAFDEARSTSFRCTVTDSGGATASPTVSLSFERYISA